MKQVRKVLNFFFPYTCYFCGREDFYTPVLGICKSCGFLNSQPLFRITSKNLEPSCGVCTSKLVSGRCEFCESRNIFFKKLFFIRYRESKEKEILHAIKFKEKKLLSNYLRIGVSKILKELKALKLEGIVMVPSNKISLRKRPYLVYEPSVNKLKTFLKVPVLDILVKNSKELQSGKNLVNRFLHARFAFSIKKELEHKLFGNYLILDDLFTTGASMNECARILIENGANEVYAFSLLKVK